MGTFIVLRYNKTLKSTKKKTNCFKESIFFKTEKFIQSTLICAQFDKNYIKPTFYKPLSANPTKWSNTLKQFVGKSRQIF